MPDKLSNIWRGTGLKPGRTRRTKPRNLWSERFARWRDALLNPDVLVGLTVAIAFVGIVGATITATRGKTLLAPGRILDETRLVRADFSVADTAATESKRALQRLRAPRVYAADQATIEQIESSLRTLPAALEAAETLDGLAQEIREAFPLTAEQFDAIKAESAREGGQDATRSWESSVTRLSEILRRSPILSTEEFQLVLQAGTDWLELRWWDGAAERIRKERAIVASSEELGRARSLAAEAGFNGPAATVVAQRLIADKRGAALFDRESTELRATEAAAEIPEQVVRYSTGQVIARRGEVLTPEALALIVKERQAFAASAPPSAHVLRGAGVLGFVSLVTFAMGGYLAVFYPRLTRHAGRLSAIAVIMAATLALACWGAANYPGWLWFAATAPTTFVAMILAVAYDRRIALAFAGAHAMLVGLALELPLSYFAATMVGVGIVGRQFNEIRNRTDVVMGAVYVAAGLAGAIGLVSLVDRPLANSVVLSEIGGDAIRGGLGGFLAGAVTFFLLPAVERIFDVTTGMTLSELRDPKHPLLRELQQRAPGTFNHSHTVATIAEAAAEAIGADGLHVYVGALYHDIGKMNKPEYFVENQMGGFNKHSRLSPAMSLLVIVGHVKDGMELAREYGLPRSLHHYIESHHGTTLVEYFYDQARKQAEAEGDIVDAPDEIEYRYPGPRPRTKEAAILMICDAVESATRALPEPTPSRIAQLVHRIAGKRLEDGQFDECELTLRELTLIEDAIVKTLNSIYHGRIAYPAEQRDETHSPDDGHGTRRAAQAIVGDPGSTQPRVG